MSTVEEVEYAIEQMEVSEQIRLLRELPSHLKITPDAVAWLELSESAFEFWNNLDDAAYDQL